MLAIELGSVTEVRPEQPEKIPSQIVDMELGIIADFSLLQFLNACSPIETTELGMITDSNPDSSNAYSPIEKTELGIIIENNLKQLAKARSPMRITELGISIDVKPSQPSNAFSLMVRIDLGRITDSSNEWSLNALFPIEITSYLSPL